MIEIRSNRTRLGIPTAAALVLACTLSTPAATAASQVWQDFSPGPPTLGTYP